MPTALRSTTSVLLLKSGSKHPEAFFVLVGSFILRTGNGSRALPKVFWPVAPLTTWSCGCRQRMGIIAGFILRYNPLCDDKGQIKRWYLALTDIDERKRA